ncbi:uncharacterized protein LOC100678453 [Nasonia vitripennis]|uniref:Uncharacterized protein n=1 Tax=Nasonia vitripennis TaxID=7425 RepID=A0A7M7Q003_NASVI|nr:uncharacterized protein LOC100678453 [Nasonia vitripennis]XP_032457115.1 uncharacterized protein LOC100678453 [Nasonia vitripennis]
MRWPPWTSRPSERRRIPCIAGKQPTWCHRPCPEIDMLCVVCHQTQSKATRVRVHPTHSGNRYFYPIMRAVGRLFSTNLWVPCHIPCIDCPNKRHGKCGICGLASDQTFQKIRWENYRRWIPSFEFVEQPYFFRDNLVQ